MKTIQIPYYTSTLDLHVEEENLKAVIYSGTDEYKTDKTEAELVEEALANPIGTPRLRELAKGKKRITPLLRPADRQHPRHRVLRGAGHDPLRGADPHRDRPAPQDHRGGAAPDVRRRDRGQREDRRQRGL